MLSVVSPRREIPGRQPGDHVFEQAEQRIKVLPGVVDVGATNEAALKGWHKQTI
jgi:hypothetical protein